MALNAYPTRDSEPEVFQHTIRLQGAGAAAMTKAAEDECAAGITVTRTGAGIVKLTFRDMPGQFVGFAAGFQATTPGDVKGHVCVADTFDETNKLIEFHVFDSGTLHDMSANEWLCLTLKFKRTKAKG